jgi:hypothetical protein
MGGEVAAAPVPVRPAGRRNLLVEEPEVTEGLPKEPMAVDAVVTAAPTATGAAPILLAQAETAAGATTSAASGGAGSATAAGATPAAGTAAAGPVSGSVIGSTGWLVALGAVGVTAVAASSNSGGSAAAPAAPAAPAVPAAPAPVTGTAIDGYLSGATVFIDVNGNGQLDTGEPSTTTDAQGNFTLPGGTSGPLVAFGGTDISTGLEFKGILKAPAGATVVTPLTTLVADMVAKTGSVANAEAAVFKALGLGALD